VTICFSHSRNEQGKFYHDDTVEFDSDEDEPPPAPSGEIPKFLLSQYARSSEQPEQLEQEGQEEQPQQEQQKESTTTRQEKPP